MIEKRDVQINPAGGYKPDVMLPSGTLHQLPALHAIPQPLSLREVLGAFRRQWLPMLLIVLVSVAFGVYSIRSATTVYRSQTTILVEGSQSENSSDPVSQVSMPILQRTLETQVQVLQSSRIVSEAINVAGIQIPPDLPESQQRDLYPAIFVEPVGESSVLRINVESSDRRYAQSVAKAVPDIYMAYVRTTRQGEVSTATENLEKRLTTEKQALKDAEAALLEFKNKRSLLPLTDEPNIRSSAAAQTRASVKQAEADVAASQRTLSELRAQRKRLPEKLFTPTTQANTAAIQAQKNKIADLKAQRNALLLRYHPDHEKVQDVDSQIRDAESYLNTIPKEIDASSESKHPFILELDRQIQLAQAELDGALTKLGRLRSWANTSERELTDYNKVQPDQNRLEQAVRDRHATIDWITERLEDLRVRQSAARDPVTVLSPSSLPVIVRPQPAKYFALSLLFGLFLAVGFALLKDSLDDKVASSDEYFRLTGLPLLGEVMPQPFRNWTVGNSGSSPRFLERYRVLRFNLGLVLAKNPAKSLVVTGSGRAEGKTEVACHLAAVASEGDARRVILVDADFRNPTVHRRFGAKDAPGLADVLRGDAVLDDALLDGPKPGLRILPSGGITSNPVDLLALPEMIDLVAKLEGMADLVIFDVSSAVGLADAHVLSRVVDSVIYVSKIGRTRRTALRKGVEVFRQTGARILGIVAVSERYRR